MRDMDMMAGRILRNLAGPQESEPRREKEETGVDHTTRPVLMERVAYLRKLARFGEGAASEILKEYPRHNIQLSVRLRSGQAEQHRNFADLFVVLDGRATLVTGGVIEKPQDVGPGEVRGAEIRGGNTQELRPGDVVHIPAGMPHQMLVTAEAGFSAMVVKIREMGEDPEPISG
jgi:mannose-6-phosphate isomerase-like protein (cupin superfamily)